MNYYVLTLFPDMIQQATGASILRRADQNGLITVEAVDIRSFSANKHMRVDDYPYGGGAGMVLEAESVYRALCAVEEKVGRTMRVIYLTPQGKVLNQIMVEEFAREESLVLLCGHYEGMDERVLEEVVTDYVSIGDYVLTGGELGAMVMIDAISRFSPGVLNNEASFQFESFQDNLLEYPHYTRPKIWHDRQVPSVLLSGNHKKIEKWRHQKSLERTKNRRPDLFRRSYQIFCIWYGDERIGVVAELLIKKLSRYGKVLNFNRRKLRREGGMFDQQDLVIFVFPGQPTEPSLLDELPQRLAGRNTPFILLTVGKRKYQKDEEEKLKLEKRGFSKLAVFEILSDLSKEKVEIERISLEIRKKILTIQLDM